MVLYEDEYVIAVSKPAGVVVHQSKYVGNLNKSSLKQNLDEEFNSSFFPIHRLDGKTTGVILFAKNKDALAQFQELFKEEKPLKKYLAIVRGFAPKKLVVDKPIGPPKSEKQRLPKDKIQYKKARTELKLLSKCEFDFSVHPYPTSRYSLVEFVPITAGLIK